MNKNDNIIYQSNSTKFQDDIQKKIIEDLVRYYYLQDESLIKSKFSSDIQQKKQLLECKNVLKNLYSSMLTCIMYSKQAILQKKDSVGIIQDLYLQLISALWDIIYIIQEN